MSVSRYVEYAIQFNRLCFDGYQTAISSIFGGTCIVCHVEVPFSAHIVLCPIVNTAGAGISWTRDVCGGSVVCLLPRMIFINENVVYRWRALSARKLASKR